jgi:hypothetical protein
MFRLFGRQREAKEEKRKQFSEKELDVFKLLGQQHQAREPGGEPAEGGDLNIARERRDEDSVVDLVTELVKEHEVSTSGLVRSILKAAIRSDDQIVDSIKMRARAEAEEEAARIIAQAKKEAGEIKRRLGSAEDEAEEILSAAEETTEEAEAPAQLEAEAVAAEAGFDQEDAELSGPKRSKSSLYAGEVELVMGTPVTPNLVAKLYNYLQMTPEIKFVRTSGSWNRGTTITVALDKPVPLVSVLSSKLPEAKVTPEQLGKGDLVKERKGVRKINIALKEK